MGLFLCAYLLPFASCMHSRYCVYNYIVSNCSWCHEIRGCSRLAHHCNSSTLTQFDIISWASNLRYSAWNGVGTWNNKQMLNDTSDIPVNIRKIQRRCDEKLSKLFTFKFWMRFNFQRPHHLRFVCSEIAS